MQNPMDRAIQAKPAPSRGRIPRRQRTEARALLLGLVLLGLPALARADGPFVAARARSFPQRLSAFARVEPEAVLPLRAQMPGVVAGLSVLPGDPVQAGQVLGKLAGPQVEALISRRRSALASTQAELEAAQQALGIERRKAKAHLSTRLAVDRAGAALAAAKAASEEARARLQEALRMQELRSPVAGSLLALKAADGERVARGQAILTLEPAKRLWLRAVYYGADAAALRVGMEGRFEPAQGGSSVAVRVRSVAAKAQPDSGRAVGMLPVGTAPDWLSGESGTVTLSGPARELAAVPTRALVLDGGRWWILVHTAKGDRPRAVVPGPSRGGWTAILQGLQPGTPVVVEDAYLEFHRDLSRHYRPPD